MRWGQKTVVGCQVDEADIEALDKLAWRFGMSRSAMMRVALREFINNSKRIAKPKASGDERASRIVDLLVETGDVRA